MQPFYNLPCQPYVYAEMTQVNVSEAPVNVNPNATQIIEIIG